MAKRKIRRLWCRPLVGSQRMELILANVEADPDLGDAEAATHHEQAQIAFREDLADERLEDCFAHEVFGHAVLDNYNIGKRLRQFLGLTELQWDAFEEEMVGCYMPAILATAKANGWLHIPKPPRRKRAPTSIRPESSKKRRTR